MARYLTGAHTKHRLQVHLVWIPKYRRRVIRGKIAIRLRQLLHEACRMNRWHISEMSIQTDHIHMIVQVNPSDSISGVVQMMKGGTSRAIRKEFPELEEFLWGDSFWADGYFAESVGHVNEEIVKRYIREQQGRP
ncbi:MAG: IS200/IS605 family transposase [Nitrospirae bacterium]|nr:IS200/IS605 family transposase [Nitrospirota bacterium]MCL5977052.1 IS200/IS605 family transposase [Nitrospirota bacterium]MCL5977067.1 IS200/IS605 family transposase [Nitrospirota bacterium]MCL5977295.1 IS200/IS605 family transposase [Nitrospirota bacterium]MCL5977434.1 IS200/IS605 family transposase [Nitrospirota bacterium]